MNHRGNKHERYAVEAIARGEKGEEIVHDGTERNRNQPVRGRRTMTRRGFTYLPGNSVSEVGERMKGGAVKEDKSPENEAILIDVRDRGSVGTVEGSGGGLGRTISGRSSKIHVDLLGRPKRVERGGGG